MNLMQVGEKHWMDVDRIYSIVPSSRNPRVYEAHIRNHGAGNTIYVFVEEQFLLPIIEVLQNPLKKVDNAENTDKTDR